MADFLYSSNNDKYRDVANVPPSLRPIPLISHFPTPTIEDIRIGYMERYFARPVNHYTGEIIEVGKSDYEILKLNSFYTIILLVWRVSGGLDDVMSGTIRVYTGVKTANRLSLQEAEKVLPGMINQIRTITQFYSGV